MLATKTMLRPSDANLPEQQSAAEAEAARSAGFNRSLLTSFAGPTPMPNGSLNFLPPPGLPMGYPNFQTQFLMGRSLLGPVSGMPASSLSQFSSGIQALQAYQQQHAGSSGQSQQRGRPNAKEIQNALDTLAAATAPATPSSDGPRQSPAGKSTLPAVVFMECDEESLSDYQCLLRKQIEVFEANHTDVQWNAQGRNKAIVLGQVGIRCKWCARLPTWSRSRGAVYYSATLDGLYQAAQNMAKNHLCKHCRLIPQDVCESLTGLRDCKRRAPGGKKYWAEGAKVLGVYQSEGGLRFKNSTICPPKESSSSS
eukprot:scaffold3437_cov113-Cylindrotheca_fusiformis.AAC.19